MKPRIGIPVPTSRDAAYNLRSWEVYATAVKDAGGVPVKMELGLGRAALLALAADCAGFCLPGSPADVDPGLYGQDRDPATEPADEVREKADYFLLEHAEGWKKPVLGVCYGCQSLNVWRGGTLVQDVSPVPVNHAAGGKVAVAHTAVVDLASGLAELLEAEEAPERDGFLRLPVNTSHHQAVGVAGEGLRVVARCPEDGVVEAIEMN